MTECSGGRGHALERPIEPGAQGAILEHVATLEEVDQHLAVVGGRALVVRAVGQDLGIELAAEKTYAQSPPADGRRRTEAACPPQQRLDIFDEVIAAEIRLQMGAKKCDLRAGLARHLSHEAGLEARPA